MNYIYFFYVIILLIIILLFYIKNTQETFLSPKVCGNMNSECSVQPNGNNTCCNGLYCTRRVGNYQTKYCSDKEYEGDKTSDNLLKLGKIVNYRPDIDFDIFDEEGELHIDLRTKFCGGWFGFPKGTIKKPEFGPIDFPETQWNTTVSSNDCGIPI